MNIFPVTNKWCEWKSSLIILELSPLFEIQVHLKASGQILIGLLEKNSHFLC